MPKKHLRLETDIEQLGQDLSRRWQPADGIEPWLRDIEPELSRKVRQERWSWEGIARALNAARILYETGRPWTGISLAQKIMSIRYEARQRTRQTAAPLEPAMPAAIPAPVLTVRGQAAATTPAPESGGYEFRPAALKGWSGAKIARPGEPLSHPKPPPAPLPLDEASAVIARLLGKS